MFEVSLGAEEFALCAFARAGASEDEDNVADSLGHTGSVMAEIWECSWVSDIGRQMLGLMVADGLWKHVVGRRARAASF